MDIKEFEKRFDSAYASALDSDFIASISKGILESNDHVTAIVKAILSVHERVLRAELQEFLVDDPE